MTKSRTEVFGKTARGEPVEKVMLRAGDLTVALLTWGAIVQSVRLAGVAHDLTLGSDRLADYEGNMRHHGSLIAPVANRITGAAANIVGQAYRFEANQSDHITLHSGRAGTQRKLWQLVEAGTDSAVLAIDLPAGEGGFPGNRRLTARFTVEAPATLRMEVAATTDAPTLMNVANHSYWNLDGTPVWSGHSLAVHGEHYLPTTAEFTPTGEICPVEGTAMDFRTPREVRVGQDLFDTNFCLAKGRRELTPALVLQGRSGLRMEIATTEPGLQVYDGRDAIRPGRTAHEGLAIEAQFWPDAPNNPDFPDITLLPGQPWTQVTEWRFSRA